MYGAELDPADAVVDVTFPEATDTDTLSVPIGASVFDPRLSALDSRLRPVPVGAPGELYLSGVQLARDYPARSGSTDALDQVALPVASHQVMLADADAGAIEFELAGLSAVASTLDTGVTKFDLQLTVTESPTVSAGSAVTHDFAGVGLGEGPAPAGINAKFTCATSSFDESATGDCSTHRSTRFLRAIIDGPDLESAELLSHGRETRRSAECFARRAGLPPHRARGAAADSARRHTRGARRCGGGS